MRARLKKRLFAVVSDGDRIDIDTIRYDAADVPIPLDRCVRVSPVEMRSFQVEAPSGQDRWDEHHVGWMWFAPRDARSQAPLDFARLVTLARTHNDAYQLKHRIVEIDRSGELPTGWKVRSVLFRTVGSASQIGEIPIRLPDHWKTVPVHDGVLLKAHDQVGRLLGKIKISEAARVAFGPADSPVARRDKDSNAGWRVRLWLDAVDCLRHRIQTGGHQAHVRNHPTAMPETVVETAIKASKEIS